MHHGEYNDSTMTVARDGGVSFKPDTHEATARAKAAGGNYSPVGGIWHWTGREPYVEQAVPGMLVSTRPDEWAPGSIETLEQTLMPGRTIRMATDQRTVAETIVESRPGDQAAMAAASACVLIMDANNAQVTALFPDGSQLKMTLEGSLRV